MGFKVYVTPAMVVGIGCCCCWRGAWEVWSAGFMAVVGRECEVGEGCAVVGGAWTEWAGAARLMYEVPCLIPTPLSSSSLVKMSSTGLRVWGI